MMIERALTLLRTIEGGYVNDPRDNGGATNHGVSIRAVRALDADKKLSTFLKDALDVDDDGDIDEKDVPGWTWEAACDFYREHYWAPLRCNDLPFCMALVVFDSGVNEGTGTAIRHLQATLGVEGDGILGVKTLAAAERLREERDGIERFLTRFGVNRLDRYRKLDDAGTYFRGWAKRVMSVSLDALKEAL